MYRLMVAYPSGEGNTFDFDYYCNTHMPLVEGFIGKDVIRSEVSRGVSGLGDDPAPYMAIGQIYMRTMAGFEKAVEEHLQDMLNDQPNYTNITPLVQIEEIV